MKNYFIKSNEKEHTCYYEFYQGEYVPGQPLWHKDSICIEDTDFEGYPFAKTIEEVVPNFDYFDANRVSKQQWEEIKTKALLCDAETIKMVEEVEAWAQENFKKYDCFTIVGI